MLNTKNINLAMACKYDPILRPLTNKKQDISGKEIAYNLLIFLYELFTFVSETW